MTEPMSDEVFDTQTNAHIDEVRTRMAKVMKYLVIAQAEHDATKLVNPEREIFREFTPKLKGCTYGSYEYKGYLEQMQTALDHHYECNRHHPEHFAGGVDDMTLMDVIEMLCDWKAATLRHTDGDIIKSIELNTERFKLSPQLAKILSNTIKFFGWESRDD